MAKGYVRKRGKNKWQLEVDLGSYIDPTTGKRKRIGSIEQLKLKNNVMQN